MTQKPLTIGVDIRVRKVNKTGIGSYIGELCREFEKLDGKDGLRFQYLDNSIPLYKGNFKLLKLIGHARFHLWKQIILPLKAFFKKCDVVFCVDECVPYVHLGYKTVATFHDAFFFETPEHYGKIWLWLYKNTAIPGARRSASILTKTFYGKKQIVHYTGLPADKLVVVYDGGPKRVSAEIVNASANVFEKFPVAQGNYLLHVGSMFKRKNLVALTNAFAKVKQSGHPNLKLVLAGSLLTNRFDNDHELILEAIEKHQLQNDVIITGYLPDGEVEQLYNNALMYVFPSLNEGFGLGVLEGFAHNIPVLVANNTCLPEVGGDAVLSFDPHDINDIAAKIDFVIQNPALQKEMISKGQKRLAEFSWESTAQQLVGMFRKAVSAS